jgi:DNA polymerase-3 subunit delta
MAISSRALNKELQSGKIYPVYLLLGEDRGAKDSFINRLEKRVIPQGTNSAEAKTVFYAGETASGEILESLNTYSIFSNKRLIIVKEIEKSNDVSLFVTYLENPIDGTVLVLCTDSKASQKLNAAAAKRGRSCVFWPMFPDEGERWVSRALKDLGITADREAVAHILELSGTGRNELENQLQLLSTFLERGEHLTLKKTGEILSQLQNDTVFDLVHALLLQPTRRIHAIYNSLLQNGEDLGRMLFFINREIQRLMYAFALKVAGHSFSEIVRTMKLRKLESERYRTLLPKLSVPYFRMLFHELHMVDNTIKSSPRELAEASFERFIASLGSE